MHDPILTPTEVEEILQMAKVENDLNKKGNSRIYTDADTHVQFCFRLEN